MRAEKLRELDNNELQAQDRDIGEQLFRLRFQLGMGQADGLKKYRVLRKDRARIQTILRERETKETGASDEAAPGEEGN
ncbi:MAG: 50S ribosomal protein L29 [bacterium]|nr:50S ribosomal protein L29 [bacterium]